MTTRERRPRERLELTRYVEEHPIGVLVGAFGVGYLLSGALFSPATARILGFGLRAGLRYATPLVFQAALGAPAADSIEVGSTPSRKRSHHESHD